MKKLVLATITATCLALGCVSTGPVAKEDGNTPGTAKAPSMSPPSMPHGPKGTVHIDVSTLHGQPLECHVVFASLGENPAVHEEVPEGEKQAVLPVGSYRAYVYIYEDGLPLLAHVQDISVSGKEEDEAFLLVSLTEGVGGTRMLRAFDFDGDLAIDRVEKDAGTDPNNTASVPGAAVIPYENRVLSEKAGWYRGELASHSNYSHGSESVAALVRRAERLGLDFLAITDENTMDAVRDPGFRSDSVVLIPAVKWGNDANGWALMYGPRTEPLPPVNFAFAQGQCLRTQAQGGAVAAAHPCLPTAPWQWNLAYLNSVQMWFRGWRDIPPLALDNLREDLKVRQDGRLVYSIAEAATIAAQSANSQAQEFWEYELSRGVRMGGIAGSGTASPKVPMASPVTWIYAKEKSLKGILEGMRLGRTYVSSGLDGPQVELYADVTNNGKIDVSIGGAVPVKTVVTYLARVRGANGKKLQVLQNGRAIFTKRIEADPFAMRFPHQADVPCAYQVRVISAAQDVGFSMVDVHAVTSPIYADDIIADLFWNDPNHFLDERYWIPLNEIIPDDVPLQELPNVSPDRPTFVIQ
jgi:hypothetical protein